jgi:hypothetical protein
LANAAKLKLAANCSAAETMIEAPERQAQMVVASRSFGFMARRTAGRSTFS